jgi:hypothetical protein
MIRDTSDETLKSDDTIPLRCSYKHAYVLGLASLTVVSFYADVFTTYLFFINENAGWSVLSGVLTTIGWAVAVHQTLKYRSTSFVLSVLLSLFGLGPIAVIAGAFRKKSLRYANDNLLKFKMRVAIVETAPQCLLKSYIFALGHLQTGSLRSASGAAQLGSLVISCISVGWTVSYRFLRALHSDCDGEFCYPVSDVATDTASHLAQRSESLTTLSSGSTTSRGLLLDHMCLSPWTLVLLRVLCSSDVLLHVLRWTVFAVAFRGYVVIPLVAMFFIACWSHAGHIHSAVRRSVPATLRALGHAAAVGITALFINAFVIGEREKGHFEHAAFWWVLDEVVVTLFLVGSVLYASHLPSVSGVSAHGICDEETRAGQVCVPTYFLLTLALLWACTQLMYGLVFVTMTCRRLKRVRKARNAAALALTVQSRDDAQLGSGTVSPSALTVNNQREHSWGAILPASAPRTLPSNVVVHRLYPGSSALRTQQDRSPAHPGLNPNASISTNPNVEPSWNTSPRRAVPVNQQSSSGRSASQGAAVCHSIAPHSYSQQLAYHRGMYTGVVLSQPRSATPQALRQHLTQYPSQQPYTAVSPTYYRTHF